MINDIVTMVELEPGLGPQYLLEDESLVSVAGAASVENSAQVSVMPSIEIDPLNGADAPTSFVNVLR